MLEWSDVLRHWWRYDNHRAAMIHRASGENIVYRGVLPGTGWHRFEYEHEDGRYPLAVEMKVVRYPNPAPEALNIPPWNTGRRPILEQRLWHVDHQRSLDLWRQESQTNDDFPPYWLWCRADIAILEAGLLWPEGASIPNAEEVSINAGWANGKWRPGFYRRVGWHNPLYSLLPSLRASVGVIFALPLTDHFLTPTNAASASWIHTIGQAVDAVGLPVKAQAVRMESSDGMTLTKPIDKDLRLSNPKVQPFTSLTGDQYLTTSILCADSSGLAKRVLMPDAKWSAPLSSYSALGRIGSRSGTETVLADGKRLTTREDIFSAHKKMWTYDERTLDYPLSSLSIWRRQFDARMNALPFSTGFELDATDDGLLQGEVGTVEVLGGFVGGLQGMTAQARLSLVAKADVSDSDWRQFF